ncbi:MAG: TetR/AcrR family transcriptional regulator [Chromatiales bacterium]|nr:MAG: TetR/AcrR family transcriptional regulator [Chromatiales bacterium]
MPRIEAESIEAHVEAQNQRILDAAMALFEERGYAGTELRDIAGSVGLARNSLYRYYPGKDHILLACLHREMGPRLERIRTLDEQFPDAQARIDAWLDVQMDIAATSCHGAIRLVENLRDHSPEFRDEVHKLHEPAADVLQRAVGELLASSGRDVELVAAMVSSLLNAAARKMMESGGRHEVMAELKRSVQSLLEAGSGDAVAATG